MGANERPPATLTELFEKLLPIALDCGIGYFEYWELSLKEIITLLDSHKRKEEARAREVLATNYNIAAMTAQFVGRILNGKRLPELEDIFPSLDVKPVGQVKTKEELEAERYKMKFMNFAMNANAQRAKRGGATTQ